MNTDVTAVIPAKIESAKKYICKQTINFCEIVYSLSMLVALLIEGEQEPLTISYGKEVSPHGRLSFRKPKRRGARNV
jgi:hypothetical protein